MKNQIKKKWTTPSLIKHSRETVDILGGKAVVGLESTNSGS